MQNERTKNFSANLSALLLLCLLLAHNAPAQYHTDLEKKLAQDIEDYTLDDIAPVEAAFILSGATSQDSLDYYLDWYHQLRQTIEAFNFDSYDRIASASKVFAYLHSSWLLTYKEKATTLLDVVNEKRYNCVAGTILYNLICQDLGWPTEAFETPTHTYTIFPDFGSEITVENTSPIGFDIMHNLQDYSRYLLQFYPKNRAYQIGLDRVYAYENSKGRRINNTELLGLLAYNRAYFANKENRYDQAYDFVRLAQHFNRDSRSNINFEINLYYRWGKQLFDRQDFNKAFQVFAAAANRYWENNDFANNCRMAYRMAQHANWRNKDWQAFQHLTNDMLDLDLMDEDELKNLRNYMINWLNLYQHTMPETEISAMTLYWLAVFPDDSFLRSLK